MNIKIKGIKRDLRFSLGAQILYEEITNKPFAVDNLQFKRDRLTLAFACMTHEDDANPLSFDDLLALDAKADAELDKVLAQELKAWYKIPDVAKSVAGETASEDERGKKKE